MRWAALARMVDMLGFDESYYAIDAASLLDSPRLTPFFPANNGRESGWMYVLALFIAGLGPTPFAARLAATCLGILAVAATYRLGRELFDTATGVSAAAGMAVLYWSVHISHLAMRANVFLLLGVLSLALLFAAHRRNRLRLWVAAGFLLGATVYSYFSAYVWFALCLIMLVVWAVQHPHQRRGALLALVVAFIAAVPMAAYALQHPDQVFLRVRQSAAITESAPFLEALASASRAWLGAWFTRGDSLLNHNIPGRPILDAPTSLLFVSGLVECCLNRKRRRVLIVCAFAIASILPSLFSEFPPHFLRSIGLTAPVALVVGLGMVRLAKWIASSALALRRWLAKSDAVSAENAVRLVAAAVPAVLVLAMTITTYHDFHETWLNLPQVGPLFEQPLHQAVSTIEQLQPAPSLEDARLYFVPYELTHPVIQLSQRRLSTSQVRAFDSRQCVIVPARPAIYVVSSERDPLFPQPLAAYGETQVLARLSGASLWRLTPTQSLMEQPDDWVAQFSDATEEQFTVEVRVSAPRALRFQPGERLTWQMRFRALRPSQQPYSLFVHLYQLSLSGEVDVNRKWAQGDQQLCASYPTTLWDSEERVIQTYYLDLPRDSPAGEYVVAIGVYGADTGERLATENGASYAVLQRIEVSR